MREKNLDLMRQDIVGVLKNSSMAFVRELVGVDPVAVFRWAIVRAFFRAQFAFRDAGKRHRQGRVDGNRNNIQQRYRGVHVPNENLIRWVRCKNYLVSISRDKKTSFHVLLALFIIPSFNLMSVTFLHIVCDSAAIWWRYPRWIWQLTESRKLWIPVFTYTSTSFRFLFLHFLIVVFLTLFWPLCWFSTSTMLDTSLTYNEKKMKHLLLFALLNIFYYTKWFTVNGL